MKTENEIENSKKRIELLESQNSRFKKLLESAVEVTKKSKSSSKTNLNVDENEFWKETIRQIENEKLQMQKDLELLSSIEDERQKELSLAIRKLEAENSELLKKVDYLLQQNKIQTSKIDKLSTEHSEFKFLLTQPHTNSQWLKNILQLDDCVTENPSSVLLEERHRLQKKIVKLESKKNELLNAIEDIAHPNDVKKSVAVSIKSDIEKALSKAITEVTKREFESLHIKVLELEEERAKLLGSLQAVLDESRQEIAKEYHKLQESILEIEKQKGALKSPSKTSTNRSPENVFDDENEEVDTILDAFSNTQRIDFKTLRSMSFHESEARRYLKVPLPTCVIL